MRMYNIDEIDYRSLKARAYHFTALCPMYGMSESEKSEEIFSKQHY